MSVIHTIYFEPVQLVSAREGLTAYFYARYDEGEEIETKPVEALAIVETIETTREDGPLTVERLVGTLGREIRPLVLDDGMGGLTLPEGTYYGNVNITFIGYGPPFLGIKEIEREFFNLREELQYAREQEELTHMDERIFPSYLGLGHTIADLFREARERSGLITTSSW
jgi:hypothetical protein